MNNFERKLKLVTDEINAIKYLIALYSGRLLKDFYKEDTFSHIQLFDNSNNNGKFSYDLFLNNEIILKLDYQIEVVYEKYSATIKGSINSFYIVDEHRVRHNLIDLLMENIEDDCNSKICFDREWDK